MAAKKKPVIVNNANYLVPTTKEQADDFLKQYPGQVKLVTEMARNMYNKMELSEAVSFDHFLCYTLMLFICGRNTTLWELLEGQQKVEEVKTPKLSNIIETMSKVAFLNDEETEED